MKRLVLALLTALMLNPAWAGPEEDALAAWKVKDYALMVKIIRPPALKGEAWAQSWLGDLYAFSQGVILDYTEAVKWFRLSALQGNA